MGALLGIVFAAGGNHLLSLATGQQMPWLIGPIGASAVLVFALPASPLAQPWPVLGGSLISALVGIVAARIVPSPELACALAIGAAIAVMSLARCLHPPGGACAMLTALVSASLTPEQISLQLLLPLLGNLVALIAAGYVYNRLTGHPWPHHAEAVQPVRHSAYDPADLDAVLEDWDEVLDVTRDDLDALFRAVEARREKRKA